MWKRTRKKPGCILSLKIEVSARDHENDLMKDASPQQSTFLSRSSECIIRMLK